jgi:hypothetical protein
MAAAVPFALAPALVDNAVIDYSTATGAKLYAKATEALKDLYNGSEGDLGLFLQQIKTRAEAFGWVHILAVPPDLADPDETINILQHYGQITLAEVQAFAATYVETQTRAAQDDAQLYQCLRKSLTKDAETNIVLHEEDYTIGERPSGLVLLKVIIREAYVDTNATVRHIREQLNSLDTHIIRLGSDIIKFNAKVMMYRKGLAARGAITTDLLNNLFKAYKAASDAEFVDYIKYHERQYDDGVTITPDHLMHIALNKYKMKLEQNTWNAPTEEQEKIIALEARIDKLIKARDKQHEKSKFDNPKRKSKQNKGKRKGKQAYAKPAWMFVAPNPGDQSKKTVDGKDYWWCTNHKSWCRHSTDRCKGLNVKNQQNFRANEGANDQSNEHTLQLSQALAHFAEAESDDDE